MQVIQEWNDLYSYTRNVVLLPVRWETHTAPEYGTRPQEVINRAIVDNCDLLIGIFWTRIGTPTGVAESGSIEEISRVARAGKPVMLYFSKVGADPDKIDVSQLEQLKKFKEQTYPNALAESYKSVIEFRDKFARQLELKVRDLQNVDRAGQPPPLDLSFVTPSTSGDGPSTHSVLLPEIENFEAVLANEQDWAKERIRTAVDRAIKKAITLPVALAIRNTGTSGIRNLYVQVSVRSSVDTIEIDDAAISEGQSMYNWFGRSTTFDTEDVDGLRRGPDGWEFSFEWVALQPQRVRVVKPRLLVRAKGTSQLKFMAKVFADSFAAPVVLLAVLDIAMHRRSCSLTEILPDLEAIRTHDVDLGDRVSELPALLKRQSR